LAHIWAVTELQKLKDEGRLHKSEQKPTPERTPEQAVKRYNKWLGTLYGYNGFGFEADVCGSFGLLKRCENGHEVLKVIVCGREWCQICGKRGSEAHMRRVGRLIDRVFSMSVVGYMVLELPVAVRKYADDKQFLREYKRYILRMLKRELGVKGIARWHYAGEDGVTYKPHLNILIEYGFLGKKQLRRLRLLCSKWLQERFDKKHYRIAPLHYQFTKKESRIWHWLVYVTRATLTTLTDANRHVAMELYGLTNITWFGSFTDENKLQGRERFNNWLTTLEPRKRADAIDADALDNYHSGLCPKCGSPAELVEGVVKVSHYEIEVNYGAGLYLVHNKDAILNKQGLEALERLYNKAQAPALASYEDALLGGGNYAKRYYFR